MSRSRKSVTPNRRRKRKRTPSRSKSLRRSRSKQKRHKSASRDRRPTRKPMNQPKRKSKKRKSRSRTPQRKREWERRQSRGWTPSLSRSRSPEHRHFTPSWTPPRMMNPVRSPNLTVILPNVSNKKRKEKKKEKRKKTKESNLKQKRRRRNERSPLPSKEVFASGNNILVSVSFNKENDQERSNRKRDGVNELTTKRIRKDKQVKRTRRRSRNVTHIKPVAIIDLERSPFKEITPSPKDVIVLTDSENGDSNDIVGIQKPHRHETSEQIVNPERASSNNYINSTGPKTPPEPQVKFVFNAKQTQLRQISNPLREPEEEEEIDPQEELENRLNEVMHKGPNTPPEPPNSPPSSPDVYDPFDPTKSRTPTPEPVEVNVQSNTTQSIEDTQEDLVDRSSIIDITDKGSPTTVATSKSHTPPIPILDIQPADSQSSIRAITPDTNIGSSPERPIGVVINQLVQPQPSIFPQITSKPSASTAYSTGAPSLITSAPVSSNINTSRIILNSSTITAPTVTSTVSQRNLIPIATKLSPVNKVAPTKTLSKAKIISKPQNTKGVWKTKNKSNENNDINIDFDSPYSPGSSDYEDLFEPPPEINNSKTITKGTQNAKNSKSPAKAQNTFDTLFGSSPIFGRNKPKPILKSKKFGHTGKGSKQVGVKLDEDNLKILDDLPSSAVEMQVKDKFLKKLNRQERVVEEVKFVLKPYYNKKRVTKEEYKDILRKAVPKICHNKTGEINPKKIQHLVEAYVKKVRHGKKVTSSSSINPQKT
ncbi:hypothetical protein FQA39_LY14638 [Lamprigera yunnana]|nr:hypothetical protein FQA39_LY14638 [Lamprigera yunnana]